MLSQLDRIAAADATVLVQGESGTGKELVAHAIHARSPRRDRPFVRLNCAALPEGMLESELFGHEKGAFTGAVRQHPGRFELAHGGSIFLDEVGAADAKVQLRLLRVLQEHEFERVGGTRTLRVDVRTIAATNVDVREEVAQGRLREDLFYRLNVVPLKLPPLRERTEDIPLLIDHFLRVHARRYATPAMAAEREVVERLKAYPWPGNIRELENTIERMAIFARHDRLRACDIPPEIAEWRYEKGQDAMGATSFQVARSLFERRFLCQALQRHRGVISEVARTIGMSRKNLYTKLDELEIDYGRFRGQTGPAEEGNGPPRDEHRAARG
jgi:two-component system nitrogen regulation response regulator NtrX